MMILRKTFDDDTSGIEVHDGEDTYRFQIDGDTAVYVGEDAVPQSVEDEIKNQGYASSVAYDVPGSVREYVDANAGGTATETVVPLQGSGESHAFVDDNGNVVAEAQGGAPLSDKGLTYIAGDTSVSPAVGGILGLEGPSGEGAPVVRISSKGSSAESSLMLNGFTTTISTNGAGSGRFNFSSYDLVLDQNSLMKMEPRDVTAVSSPVEGMMAYNDGTTGTAGPAFYDGSSWTSMVDGSTI